MMEIFQNVHLSAATGQRYRASPVLLDYNFLPQTFMIRFIYDTAGTFAKLIQYFICI